MARKTRLLTPRDLERRVAAAERRAVEFLDLSRQRLERRDSSSPERRNTIVRLEQRAIGDDGTIEGYGSVFNVVDDWGDIIVPGAFAATLAAHKAAGTMPAMLWQHRDAEPIGVWTDMVEDSRGLRVKGRLVLEAPRGKEAHALLKAGALNGLSIGFISRTSGLKTTRFCSIIFRVLGCVLTMIGNPYFSAIWLRIQTKLLKFLSETMFSSRCALTTK